jgi:hypothetical protein
MKLVKLFAAAGFLCAAGHFAVAEADPFPPGGSGAAGRGAPRRTTSSSERPEALPVKPWAAPLGTEVPPEELERRKREMEHEQLPPSAVQQTDQGR